MEDISESQFFDPRISAKPNIRTKRALRFHEPGKFQQLADRMRMKVCRWLFKYSQLDGIIQNIN